MSRASVLVAAAALLASAGAVVLAGQDVDPIVTPVLAPQVVPATKAALICPATPPLVDVPGPGGTRTVFAVSPAAEPADASDGKLTVAGFGGARPQPLGKVGAPGSIFKRPLAADQSSALPISADGALAPGLTGAVDSVPTGKARGIDATWCSAAASDWWFSGVNTAVGATTRLVISNPSPAVAIVNLSFFGRRGEIRAAGARGIPLAPQSQQVLELERYAPGLAALTVNVRASTGRVVAALHSSLSDGVTQLGQEWVAPGQAPATELVVNPSTPDADSSTLQITNPGDREALVQLQVIGATGPFSPEGLTDLRIKPGQILVEDVTDVFKGQPTGISITSTVPVTGAVVDTSKKPADFSVVGSSPALGERAVVPVLPGRDLTLAFASAQRIGGKVSIEAYDRDGESVSKAAVNLRGFATTTWKLKGGARTAAYVVVTVVVDGATHATAHYSSDDGITSLPVLSGIVSVSRPAVSPAL